MLVVNASRMIKAERLFYTLYPKGNVDIEGRDNWSSIVPILKDPGNRVPNLRKLFALAW